MKQTSFNRAKYIKIRNPKVAAAAILLAIVLVPFLVRYTVLLASSRMKPEGNKEITFFNGKEWVEAKLVKAKNDTTTGPKRLYFFNGKDWVDAGIDETGTDAANFPVVDITKPTHTVEPAPDNNNSIPKNLEANTTPGYTAPTPIVVKENAAKVISQNNTISIPSAVPAQAAVDYAAEAKKRELAVEAEARRQAMIARAKVAEKIRQTDEKIAKATAIINADAKKHAVNNVPDNQHNENSGPTANELQAQSLIADASKPVAAMGNKVKVAKPLAYSIKNPQPDSITKFINNAIKKADDAKKAADPKVPTNVKQDVNKATGGTVKINSDGTVKTQAVPTDAAQKVNKATDGTVKLKTDGTVKTNPSPMQKFLTTPYDTAAEKAQIAKDKGEKVKKEDKKTASTTPPPPAMTADDMKKYIDAQIATALELNKAKEPEPVVAQVDSSAFKAAKAQMDKELEEKKQMKEELDAQVDQQQEKMKDARLNAQPGLRDTVPGEGGKFVVREERLALSKQVFAWFPYWMGESYTNYDFGLMSTVAYYGYEVDASTGSYSSIHDWKTTSMIAMAQKKNCKVVLTAALIGEANIAKFLANKNAQRTFIDSIRSLVILRNANGVNIDFEGLSNRYRTDYTMFINALTVSLKSINPSYQISITLPAVDMDDAYDVAAMEPNVDIFIMMGYDYSSTYSVKTGATSPLGVFSGNSLPSCIDAWLSKKINSTKLLLGLPYYGVVWQVDGAKAPARMVKFIGHATFDEIKQKYAGTDPDFYEASMTPYYHGPIAGTSDYEQVWFENDHSLNLKYNLVEEKKLGGIGMWALGMDGDDKSIWSMIETKFVRVEKVPVETITIASKEPKESATGISKWFKRKFRQLYSILRRPSTFNPNKSGFDNILKVFMVLGGVTFLFTRFVFIYRRLQMGDKWKGQNYFVYIMLFGIGLFTICLLLYAYVTMFFQKMFHSKGFLFSIGLMVGIVLCAIFVLYIIPKMLRTKDLP